ncbi:2447_t:CDS:2, partial [Acaulospora morrowiae]
WANEKVGSGQKTQLTDEFLELQQKTEERHNGLDKLHAATKNYLKTMSKKTESEEKMKTLPIEALGSTIRNYGEEIGVESAYGSSLVKLGTANEKIANLQLEFVSRVREEFLEGLESTIGELKQYQQLKRKLESRRLDYDAKLNRVQKSKKEKPELEEELRASKEKYDETMEELYGKMQHINDSEEQYVQELTSFLDAQLEYYKKSFEILSGVKDDWVESSSIKPKRRTPVRKTTSDSYNSHSDDVVDEQYSDSGSVHSNHDRSKKSRPTPKRTLSRASNSKSEDSYNTSHNVSSSSRRKNTASGGSSVKTTDARRAPSTRKTGISQSTKKKQVRAIYSYEGGENDELAMEEGEIITVLEEHEGWWIGEIIDPDGSKRSGMFPANYTEELKEQPENESIDEEDEDDLTQNDYDQYDIDELDEEPVQRNSPPSSRYTSTRQTPRSSRVPNSDGSPPRVGSTVSTPPVPSRNSKPPPVRSKSRAVSRQTTSDFSTDMPRSSSPTNIGGRSSYIPQEYIEKSVTSNRNFGPCKECGCDDYSPNVFKKDSCNNCFHKH